MKKNVLKLTTTLFACLAMVSISSVCYNAKLNNSVNSKATENNGPIVFNEVSSYDTLYDFSNDNVLAEHSDLIVLGKIKEIGVATNYNPSTKKYGKARTPGTIEVLQVLKEDNNLRETSQNLNNSATIIANELEFMDMGGTISYADYEKSLLPAQKDKRDYLMSQSGVTAQARATAVVNQEIEKQLELEEDNTYIMYLKYNEDFGKYMVVNQPYGIKEYNAKTGKILNHVTNEETSINDLM